MIDKQFYVLWSIMIVILNIYFIDNSELNNYLKKNGNSILNLVIIFLTLLTLFNILGINF